MILPKIDSLYDEKVRENELPNIAGLLDLSIHDKDLVRVD